jgi:LytS/YehU family sensor histidine kinase
VVFLDIEQVRFGDRLRVTYDVDEEAYRALVPLLLLQPLVENATRHGIGKVEGQGTITIAARVAGNRLAITIENSGAARLATDGIGTGIGLANVRERLEVLYGDSQELLTTVLTDGGFRVEIKLPFTASAPAHPASTSDGAIVLGV